MNYFELFNLTPNFEYNKKDLESVYLDLQKQYHPDNCETVEQQLAFVEKTILINKAYDCLSNDVSLLVYYLKTILNIELTEKEIKQNLSQENLMYLLDMQEEIAENPLKINDYKCNLKNKLENIATSLKQDIEQEKNKQEITNNLAKLMFYHKSLKHI